MARLALMCEDDDLLRESARKYFEVLPLHTDSPEEQTEFVAPTKRLPSARGVFTASQKAQNELRNWLKLAEVEI